MATTKQAEREQTDSLLADEYLSDLVYFALLERGEAARVSEITAEINNPRINESLVRRMVSDSPRFLTVGRMWDLSARFLDRSYSTERNLNEILEAAGRPLSTAQIATELSNVYERSSEVYLQMLGRILRNDKVYFKTAAGEYGLTDWLAVALAEEEDDILADNRLRRANIQPYLTASGKVQWSVSRYAEATFRLVEAAKRAVPHKLLGVLAWLTLREKYKPTDHFSACYSDIRLIWLSGKGGGRWITRAHAERLELLLEQRGLEIALKEGAIPTAVVSPEPESRVDRTEALETVKPTEREEPATALRSDSESGSLPTFEKDTDTVQPEPVSGVSSDAGTEDATPAESERAPLPLTGPEITPLNIGEDDIAALEAWLAGRDAPTSVEELLAARYEVVPGDPSFASDMAALEERLRTDNRFLYVGAGRYREPNSLPIFVYDVPEFLTFPDLQFISMDGEIMDEEIQDEGFANNLRQEILNPLVQDAGDDEGRYTGNQMADGASVRLVVKAHHKEIGTFPLCQVPDGFLPNDAEVVEVVIRDPNGDTHNIIVSYPARLAFNLFGLYEFLTVESGAVFTLHKTERAYEYRFEPEPNPDPQVFLDPTRLADLQALREHADDTGDMATFDITCEVLAHYPKGLDFVQLMTEVNIVRRVTRRKLSSILSIYQCFVHKPGQPQWRFDAKKRDLGTDRTKRKYIKR